MFENIGYNARKLAICVCILGVVGSITGGIILFSINMIVLGILAAIVGSLISGIGSWVIYCVGAIYCQNEQMIKVADEHTQILKRIELKLSLSTNSVVSSSSILTANTAGFILNTPPQVDNTYHSNDKHTTNWNNVWIDSQINTSMIKTDSDQYFTYNGSPLQQCISCNYVGVHFPGKCPQCNSKSYGLMKDT